MRHTYRPVYIVLAAAAFALAACEDQGGTQSESSPPAAIRTLPAPTGGLETEAKQSPDAAQGESIARMVRLHIQTNPKSLGALIEGHANYCRERAQQSLCILENVEQTGGLDPSGQIQMRIAPTERAAFEAALNQSLEQAQALLLHRGESAENLTAQVIDVEARLESLKAARDKLQALLAEARGARLGDLAAAQAEIGRIQGEIESYEQQRRFLTRRVDWVEVSISYASMREALAVGFWSPIEAAVRDFLRLVVESAAFIIRALAVGLPILPLLAVAGWGFMRWRRRRQARS